MGYWVGLYVYLVCKNSSEERGFEGSTAVDKNSDAGGSKLVTTFAPFHTTETRTVEGEWKRKEMKEWAG